jgi:hypothetical protein
MGEIVLEPCTKKMRNQLKKTGGNKERGRKTARWKKIKNGPSLTLIRLTKVKVDLVIFEAILLEKILGVTFFEKVCIL